MCYLGILFAVFVENFAMVLLFLLCFVYISFIAVVKCVLLGRLHTFMYVFSSVSCRSASFSYQSLWTIHIPRFLPALHICIVESLFNFEL